MSGSKFRAAPPYVWLIALSFVFICADRLGGFFVGHLVKESDFRLSRLYDGGAQAEIVILGNSVANAMTLPDQLAKATNHSVFSLAVHGLDGRTQKVFVDDLLARGEAPKLAILEIRPVTVRDVLAGSFTPYRTFSSELGQLIDETSETVVPWSKLSKIYGFNSRELPSILQKVIDRDDQATGPSDGAINEGIKAKWLASGIVPSIQEPQLKAMVETIKALQSAGSKVVVVAAPMHPVTRAKGVWATTLVGAVAKALPEGVSIYNFVDLVSDDKSFEDPSHLNAHGRATFLPLLASVVKEKLG